MSENERIRRVERLLKCIDQTHKRGQLAVRQCDWSRAEVCVKRAKNLSRKLAELRTPEFVFA